MIETVVEVGLPVDENIIIKKNRLTNNLSSDKTKRIAIVTGTHGDELEGQYVCYELIKRINENIDNLRGIVDIYPSLNPLGIDSITRGIPMFDLDMNRVFPGDESGALAEHIAGKVIQDLKGADMCIDIHSSNIFLREIPQVRINKDNAEELIPYAKLLNTDFIWVNESATVLKATLAHSLNSLGVPTLVVEMGVGMRITKEYCHQLVDGIFALMNKLGIWNEDNIEVKDPIVCNKGNVAYINSNNSGVFIPLIEHWENINEGNVMGKIINPLTGEVLEEIIAPVSGMVFTLREYPVVYKGSLLARILGGEE